MRLFRNNSFNKHFSHPGTTAGVSAVKYSIPATKHPAYGGILEIVGHTGHIYFTVQTNVGQTMLGRYQKQTFPPPPPLIVEMTYCVQLEMTAALLCGR